MMTKLRIGLAFLMCLSPLANGANNPGVLIDFTRYDSPFGVAPLPHGLSAKLPHPTDRLALTWVLVEPTSHVLVGLIETEPHEVADLLMMRAMVLKIPTLEAYREAVAEHPDLNLSQEIVDVLRARRREVGLNSRSRAEDEDPSTKPIVLEDHRAKSEIPADAILSSIKLRAVELNGEGELRLSLSGLHANGEPFSKSVNFENLDEFNRASGENVTTAEFNRQTLLYWIYSGDARMGGRYAMKTRDEISHQCAELLRIGVRVSPEEKPAPEGPDASGESKVD